MPDNTFLVVYMDDVAAVRHRGYTAQAQPGQAQGQLLDGRHGPNLTTEKTEIVLLIRQWVLTIVYFLVGDKLVISKPVVKYLGVHLDTKLLFWEQVLHSLEKFAAMLSSLMANTGGPAVGRQQLLTSVTNSFLL